MLSFPETRKFASQLLLALKFEAYIAFGLIDPCINCRRELGVFSSWYGHTTPAQTTNGQIIAQAYRLLAELLSVYDEHNPVLTMTPSSFNSEGQGGVSLGHFFVVVVSERHDVLDKLCALLILYTALVQPLQVCQHNSSGSAPSVEVSCKDPYALSEFLSSAFGVEPRISCQGSDEARLVVLTVEKEEMISVTVASEQVAFA